MIPKELIFFIIIISVIILIFVMIKYQEKFEPNIQNPPNYLWNRIGSTSNCEV
jgi:hypothetical protein